MPVAGNSGFVAGMLFDAVSQHLMSGPMHFVMPARLGSWHSPTLAPKHCLFTSGSVSRSGSTLSILASQSLSLPSHTSFGGLVGVHWYSQPLSPDPSMS